MSVIYVLIPLAVIIVAIAIAVFFWAVKSNQFDDLERQGYSILFDDDLKPSNDDSTSSTLGNDQICDKKAHLQQNKQASESSENTNNANDSANKQP